MPAELTGLLSHDAFQVALIVHPNEYSKTGLFDLSRWLAPALTAGLVLSHPYEEWAALLVAADAVVTDHGSTALYAAALGQPVIGAYDGGRELIPGSPMARLLDSAPRMSTASGLEEALRESRTIDTRGQAAGAFAQQGQALQLLRQQLYQMLGLQPPSSPLDTPAFPGRPRRPISPRSSRYELRCRATRWLSNASPRTRRRPYTIWPPNTHGGATPDTERRRALVPRPSRRPAVQHTAWTAAGWTAHVLEGARLQDRSRDPVTPAQPSQTPHGRADQPPHRTSPGQGPCVSYRSDGRSVRGTRLAQRQHELVTTRVAPVRHRTDGRPRTT
ncbi:hypothetical protein NKH18_24000 [Streptomyces sp. M10(2022)]